MAGLGVQERQEAFIQPIWQLLLITVIPEKPVTVNYLQTHEPGCIILIPTSLILTRGYRRAGEDLQARPWARTMTWHPC